MSLHGRVFSVCSTKVKNTRMVPGLENCRSVWLLIHSDSHIAFFSFSPKVRVLLVHLVLQLKVLFCQMALPTPVAAPAPAISPASPRSRSTPSSRVPWRVPSHRTTSMLGVMVMEWPTRLPLAKVSEHADVWACGWVMLSRKVNYDIIAIWRAGDIWGRWNILDLRGVTVFYASIFHLYCLCDMHSLS